MKKLLVTMVLALCFSGIAKADLLFEPYIGTEAGKFSNADATLTGTAVGARIAYKLPLFVWAGLDLSLGSSGKYKGVLTDADMKHTSYYGVVGVNLPILLRGWVGYGVSDQFVIDSPINSTMKSNATKIGIGLTPLPLVCLNVEYIKGTVSEISGGTLAKSSPSTTSESYMFSVSLPLYY